jgi:hypothetical protein
MPPSPETTIKLSNFLPIVCQKSRQGSAGAKYLRNASQDACDHTLSGALVGSAKKYDSFDEVIYVNKPLVCSGNVHSLETGQ